MLRCDLYGYKKLWNHQKKRNEQFGLHNVYSLCITIINILNSSVSINYNSTLIFDKKYLLNKLPKLNFNNLEINIGTKENNNFHIPAESC